MMGGLLTECTFIVLDKDLLSAAGRPHHVEGDQMSLHAAIMDVLPNASQSRLQRGLPPALCCSHWAALLEYDVVTFLVGS